MDDEVTDLQGYLRALGWANLRVTRAVQEQQLDDEKQARKMVREIEDKIMEISKMTNGVSI